ncbi:recombinase family protein [Mycobacteroides abscessus]|nr:recombinase family protein [Mycobacteroides abscessus]MDM2427266.1 recombinase family protein [Mycobacteroides abscessus]MDM2432467.1 recombinase family protein [Mycobacteroides abscessus]MDM2437239.1 recombinase family protein [Mycobacteroides abscessus]
MALDRVFIDQVSGKDASRPQLEAALAYVREGDTLVVHSMHRLARNLEDLRRPGRSRTRAAVSLSASLAPCSRGVAMGRGGVVRSASAAQLCSCRDERAHIRTSDYEQTRSRGCWHLPRTRLSWPRSDARRSPYSFTRSPTQVHQIPHPSLPTRCDVTNGPRTLVG